MVGSELFQALDFSIESNHDKGPLAGLAAAPASYALEARGAPLIHQA